MAFSILLCDFFCLLLTTVADFKAFIITIVISTCSLNINRACTITLWITQHTSCFIFFPPGRYFTSCWIILNSPLSRFGLFSSTGIGMWLVKHRTIIGHCANHHKKLHRELIYLSNILREQKTKNRAVSNLQTDKSTWASIPSLLSVYKCFQLFLVKILSWCPLNTLFVLTTWSKFSHDLEGHVSNTIVLTVLRMENQSCVTWLNSQSPCQWWCDPGQRDSWIPWQAMEPRNCCRIAEGCLLWRWWTGRNLALREHWWQW